MLTWGTLLKQSAQTALEQLLEKLGWKTIATIALLLLTLFGAPFLIHSHPSTVEVKSLIFAGLQNVDELATVTMDAKATVKLEKTNEFLGMQIGQTNFVYEGVSKVQAGINLKQLQVQSISPDRRKVHIVLPAPYIRDLGLDVEHSTILADYTDWFADKSTPELQEEAQLKAMAVIKQQSCEGRILEAANSSAKALLTGVLTKVGFNQIEIDTQLPQESACR
jgi:hypothetical protein